MSAQRSVGGALSSPAGQDHACPSEKVIWAGRFPLRRDMTIRARARSKVGGTLPLKQKRTMLCLCEKQIKRAASRYGRARRCVIVL